jgi:hypothetical protein
MSMSLQPFSEREIFGYFMQDGATVNTNFINALNEAFQDRLAHHRLWPASFSAVNP